MRLTILIMATLIKDIKLKIGKLSIYDNNACVIEVLEEDYVTDKDVSDVVHNCEDSVVGSYALISNRKQSYSTNPLELYKILALSKRLKAAAIVSYRESTTKLFTVEKVLEKEVTNNELPMEMFADLGSALEWVSSVL